MRRILLLAAVALAACQPPSPQTKTETPPPPTTTTVAACNDVAPDASKQVTLQSQPLAAAALAEGLDGGPVTPGTYDLASGNVADGAPAWTSSQAVALNVTEAGGAVTFNYAALPSGGGDADRWTAAFREGPPAGLSFSCGRTGDAPITFEAQGQNLRLMIPAAGGTGSVFYNFVRRG